MTGQAALRLITPTPAPPGTDPMELLSTALRDEFAVELYAPDPDDPVLGGRCGVPECRGRRLTRGLCPPHYERWIRQRRPDWRWFCGATPPRPRTALRRSEMFDLRPFGPRLRAELGYVLQCRHDERGATLSPAALAQLVALLEGSGAVSLLDWSLPDWLTLASTWRHRTRRDMVCALLRYAHPRVSDLLSGADAETEYAYDVWRASAVGVAEPQGRLTLRFDSICQDWLRQMIKRWVRLRLAAGRSWNTVRGDVKALNWFSAFLADRYDTVTGPAGLTRAVLEHYLSWLATTSLGIISRQAYLGVLRTFLDEIRRHGWWPQLPRTAALFSDDLPRPPARQPRFIPEYVMAQLESDTNLAHIPDIATRHLIILLIETGLRAGDACRLRFDPLIDDSVGWPCLQFDNSKVAAEQLVPLSPKAADVIRAQQQHVLSCWPGGSRWLFPRQHANPDATKPWCYSTLQQRLKTWQQTIDLRDEAGTPVRVTAHRFRHTLGTRMINSGVPQHIVQKLLGHASPAMTAVYASLHDSTLRAAFDDYQRNRVNIAGEILGYDPTAATSDAEWVKHSLARVRDSLPNGYCGRPPQQDCPHPNACLTCPDFQTTPVFLPIHRRQRDNTLELIDIAEQHGQHRLADNHRKVLTSLDQIIPALETLDEDE